MALKLGHSNDGLDINHDINVTPFIDVMLVLLIIFMVAAPLATVNVPIDLPVSSAEAQPQREEPIVVSLESNLGISIGNDHVDRAELASQLQTRTKGDRNARIFLRADKTVPYGDLMTLMNSLREAGYLKVALVGLEQGVKAQ
jgi:biopolymer transport protein ExbD